MFLQSSYKVKKETHQNIRYHFHLRKELKGDQFFLKSFFVYTDEKFNVIECSSSHHYEGQVKKVIGEELNEVKEFINKRRLRFLFRKMREY
jgi:phosphoenolpyruvate carboxylase